MFRRPEYIRAHNPLQVDLALALQVLYVLGKAEIGELGSIIQQLGPLDTMHKLHLHTALLLERGVRIRAITPFDSHKLAGANSEAYLRDILSRGGFTPAAIEQTVWEQHETVWSRAAALCGHMQRWPGRYIEEARPAQPADVLGALEGNAIVHVRAGIDVEYNILAVPISAKTCWVYNIGNGKLTSYPTRTVAIASQQQVAIYTIAP